jgi:hypothetical protein
MGPALVMAKELGLLLALQLLGVIITMVLGEELGMAATEALAVHQLGYLVLVLEDHLMGLPGSLRPLGLVVALGVGITQVAASSVHLGTLWLEELEEAGYA